MKVRVQRYVFGGLPPLHLIDLLTLETPYPPTVAFTEVWVQEPNPSRDDRRNKTKGMGSIDQGSPCIHI